MTRFYSGLISIQTLLVELDSLDLSSKEKNHLTHLIDSNLHNEILDAVLSELNTEEKGIFLRHLAEGDDKKIWGLLNSRVENIEQKIKETADKIKKELHKDLKEAKRIRKEA